MGAALKTVTAEPGAGSETGGRKSSEMAPPRQRKSETEQIPLWSWTVLMALVATSFGMWYPSMDHWRRETMGWSLLAIIVGWVVKFGNNTAGLAMASVSAICIMFGTTADEIQSARLVCAVLSDPPDLLGFQFL
jgi:hypothetical protein